MKLSRMNFDRRSRGAAQGGFTLVEMALVLVVIGLILGAVSIGKDLQRNAEYKKMKQKFVDQWVQDYNQYYDRTGYVLGDIEKKPLLMVNASVLTPVPTDPTTVTTAGTALCSTNLLNMLAAVGIAPPPGRGPGLGDADVYLDSNGNPQQASVCFQWLPPTTVAATVDAGVGNVMVISGLTPDLARYLDSSIDGQVDGQSGRFRCATSKTDFTACDWPTGNNVAADGTTAVSDTERVQTVVGVYRMNQ